MNIYQRPLFRQAGGPIAPEMGPMMPPQGMPPAPMAAPQMMPPQGLDPRAAEAVGQVEQGAAMQAEQYGQNMMAGLDAAETPEEVINAMRGNQRPLEARYGELAELVGQEDAQRTPETVLALLQPVMMMTEQGAMDSGIGELMGQLTGNIDMMDESGAPTEMGQGVGSLMMAGVGQQPVANFSQGGAVQRFQVGGEASRLQELYSEMLPVYQGVMGGGEDQRDLTKAQIFFDIADRFGAFAAGIDPRTGERMQGSAAAQFGAAASGLGGQIGERLGAQDQQERALRVAALQGAAGEFSAERADERAAARAAAAGEKDRALGSLYDILDAEGNVLQKGVPIATQGQYAKIVEDNPGIRIVPSRIAEAGFGTTTLYNPETGAPTTFNTETAAGQAAANAALAEGFTTEKPAEAGFGATTLYDPTTGAPTTFNIETPEGQAAANAALAEGFTTEKPAEAGFGATTLYDPTTGAPTTFNTETPEGQAAANAALAEGFTTEKPAEAGFNTTTLYDPRTNAATTFNIETPEGQAAANAALAEGFTTEKRPEAGFNTVTLYNPVTYKPTTFNTETAAGRAAANAALRQGFTTEKPAEAGFGATTLYDPTTGAPTTFNTKTPEGLAAANAALAEGFTAQKPESVKMETYVNPNNPSKVVYAVVGSPEAMAAEANGMLPVGDATGVFGMLPKPPDDPPTLVERQQIAVTDQRTLDNLERLSAEELSRFAATAAAYTQETVGPAGVSSRLPLPPNTQAAMKRAYLAGTEFPGIDPTLFGAPLRSEDVKRMGLAILDSNNVDLGAATGFLSTFARGINFLGEQFADVFGGTGTVFTETADASAALNTLAQATRRFYIEGRTLAKEFELLQQEIPTFSGLRTDRDARQALENQRGLLEGELARVRDVLENPRSYTNADISKARQLEAYASQLLATYDQFIGSYRGLDGGTAGTKPNPADFRR
jgi:hypothetical protein